jgi:formylmethanofuran dehydrogenase subunit E
VMAYDHMERNYWAPGWVRCDTCGCYLYGTAWWEPNGGAFCFDCMQASYLERIANGDVEVL